MIRLQTAPWSNLDPSELPGLELELEVKKKKNGVISQVNPEKVVDNVLTSNGKNATSPTSFEKDKRLVLYS